MVRGRVHVIASVLLWRDRDLDYALAPVLNVRPNSHCAVLVQSLLQPANVPVVV